MSSFPIEPISVSVSYPGWTRQIVSRVLILFLSLLLDISLGIAIREQMRADNQDAARRAPKSLRIGWDLQQSRLGSISGRSCAVTQV